jgi:hypothetical protein
VADTPARAGVVAAVTFVCVAWLGFAAVDPPPGAAAGSNSLTVTADEYSYGLSGATSITMLDAGRYALVSFLRTPDGTSDAANGMVTILTVRARQSDLSPPTRNVVDVTTSDRAITLPGGETLPARGWARITTTATSPRDFELFRYSTPDATFESANAYFKEFFSSGDAPPGPAPAVIVGNISSIGQGAVVYYKLSLERADYVVVSDTASDQDGSAQVHQDVTVE